MVRWSAARALGTIGSERAVEALLPLLKDPETSVRGRAADQLQAIASHHPSGVLEAALLALDDPSYAGERKRLLAVIRTADRAIRTSEAAV